MEFEYDPAKSAANKAKHGVDFEEAKALWNDRDLMTVSAKTVKGETRDASFGVFRGKHYTAITTQRDGKTRIISFRRSHDDEEACYEQGRADNN